MSADAKQLAALRARALRLLALREQSRAELERKLSRVRAGQEPPEPEAVHQVLDALQRQGLLDEARFAASLTRRLGARYGGRHVAGALRQHGLAPDLVDQALRDLQQQPEAERALELLRKHHPEAVGDAAQRLRLQRFLQRRGFSFDAIRAAIRALGAPADGQPESGAPIGPDCADFDA